MEDMQTALAYLNQNRLLYLDMLEVLRRGSAEVLQAGADGVLLYDWEGEEHMLSARSRAALEGMLPALAGSETVVGHEMWYRDELAERLGLWEEMPCYQAAWLSPEPPELPPFGGELRPLGMEWAPFVLEHYSNSAIGGLPHVEEALRRGMLGAFVDGAPAGFVGFHPEGTIGLLEVLPPYRRRGLGEVLLLGAVRLALARGQYAFGQVLVDNAPSLALQRKAGMTISAETLYWLFRPEGTEEGCTWS